ncbi:phosphatidylglycerophosphatase A [bacterium]|nr:phosphatidylglycerophosphatase A [bacterium]
MWSKNIFVPMATLGPIGYFPASGTIVSFIALLFIYFFSSIGITQTTYVLITFFLAALGFYVIGKSIDHFRLCNPSEIVFDEVIGCFVTFCYVPLSLPVLGIGFVAFRFFDIVKPFGIKKCNLLYGSLGIVMDDIFAGLFANIVIQIALHFL